jgi:6-phosphofructokinase
LFFTSGCDFDVESSAQVIDKSFGFDTAVEEAQRAINAAHVEAESAENGIGVVKLMGRNSGRSLSMLQICGYIFKQYLPLHF